MPPKSRWLQIASAEPEDEHPLEALLEFSEGELFLATHVFDAGQRLGFEAHSEVYRGVMRDKYEVAVKVLEIGGGDASRVGLAEDVLPLSQLRHANVATLVGWAAGSDRCYVVYELVDGADVAQRLRSCQESGAPFDWEERLWAAADVAEGLAYMHGRNPQVFHRNLKSANVVIDGAGLAKLADFGLPGVDRVRGANLISLNHRLGTPGDACPADVKSGRITEMTEVYAFGMLLLELLLNLPPVSIGGNGEFIYPIFHEAMPRAPGALERALDAVDPLAGWPPALVQELVNLALACIAEKDVARPCIAEAVAQLRELCGKHCRGIRPTPACVGRGPQTRGFGPHPITIKIPAHRDRHQASSGPPRRSGPASGRPAPPGAAARPGGSANRFSCFLEWDPSSRCRVGCERPGDSAEISEMAPDGSVLSMAEETVYRL